MRAHVALAVALGVIAACKGDTGPAGPAGQSAAATGGGAGVGVGLQYEIRSATVSNGSAPTVTFRVTDDAGSPVALKKADGTLAFTPSFTLAQRGTDGRLASLLTRAVTGKPWVGTDGKTNQPVLPSAIQAVADATTATGAADRLTGGEDGVYTYTFAAPVSNVTPGATHRVGVWGNRTVNGVAYPASNTLDFAVGGGAPTGSDLVADDQCSRCHGIVRAHGDQRLGVKICLTCHETQGTPEAPMMLDPETGASVYMPTMIHKIHAGTHLTKGYTVVGFAPNNPSTFPASAVLDFGATVSMAPSHSTYLERTFAGTGAAGAAPVNDPGLIRRCDLCHGTQAATVQVAQTLSKCADCHDQIDPRTGAGHSGGAVAEGTCQVCHAGTVAPTVTQGHSEAFETTRNVDLTPGSPHKLEITIDNVANVSPGQAPLIDFTVKFDGQPFDISTKGLAALGFQMAGPVTDYAQVIPNTPATSTNIAVSPGVSSALVAGATNVNNVANTAGYTTSTATVPANVKIVDAAQGKFQFQFPATQALPADAKGTYVFSYEAMWKDSKKGPNGETISKPYAAQPVFHGSGRNVAYRNVSGGAAAERRAVVDNNKCNTCHVDLGFHGNRSRKGIDYCATCHNPNLDNRGRFRFQGPVGTKVQVESVSANVYIHRIHMGADLPSVQAGGTYQLGAIRTAGNAGPEQWAAENNGEEGLSDFSDFQSPRPVLACDTCHAPNGWALPTSAGRLPIRRALVNCDAVKAAAPDQGWCSTRTVAQETFTPPTTAVCTSCHDSQAAIAHAAQNTVFPTGQDRNSYNPYASPTALTPDPTKEAVETCSICHGTGADFDVLKVHQAPAFLP